MSHPYYGLNELREMFLSFFETKDHLRLPSFSLVPQNDNSILLINAGMTPMKPWFKGEEEPPRRRVCTCQKCIRTGDIENVGKTARHGTYFEMLGNFSFGDYFKHEAIAWSWEFLTKVVGLEEDRLYPSIYESDDEAWNIWHDEVGIPAEKIFRFGKEDNFWEHGSGPCGPCSEIYYDRGPEYGCGKPGCTVGCDCDRYIEIWNSQFDNDGHDNYTELKQKNIDTGMGLERLACVCQNVDSLFDVDTVMNITHKVSELTGAHYGESEKRDVSLRVITDHIRSATFMICDGILPAAMCCAVCCAVRRATASSSASTIRSCIRSSTPLSTRTSASTLTCARSRAISPRSSAPRKRASAARSTAACASSVRCSPATRSAARPCSPARTPSSCTTPSASPST